MKKAALLVALLMVIGVGSAWCLSATVDRVLDDQSKSDLRPVQDTAKLANLVNKGIDKSYNTVTKPMNPVLDPIRQVRDSSVRASKEIVNRIWDALTYFSPHRKK